MDVGDLKDGLIYELMVAFVKGGWNRFDWAINRHNISPDSFFAKIGPQPTEKHPHVRDIKHELLLLSVQRDIFRLEFPILLTIFRNLSLWEEIVTELKKLLKVSQIDPEEIKILRHYYEIYRYARQGLPKSQMVNDFIRTRESSGLGEFGLLTLKLKFPVLTHLFRAGKNWYEMLRELKKTAEGLLLNPQAMQIISPYYEISEPVIKGIPLTGFMKESAVSQEETKSTPLREQTSLFSDFLEKVKAGTTPANILGVSLAKLGGRLVRINPLHPALEDILIEADRIKVRGSRPLNGDEVATLEGKLKQWSGDQILSSKEAFTKASQGVQDALDLILFLEMRALFGAYTARKMAGLIPALGDWTLEIKELISNVMGEIAKEPDVDPEVFAKECLAIVTETEKYPTALATLLPIFMTGGTVMFLYDQMQEIPNTERIYPLLKAQWERLVPLTPMFQYYYKIFEYATLVKPLPKVLKSQIEGLKDINDVGALNGLKKFITQMFLQKMKILSERPDLTSGSGTNIPPADGISMESIEDFNEKMQLIGQLRDVSGELQELNKNTGSAVLQQSLFERIISRAQAGFPAQNLAVMLNELRPKLLQKDPLDPWILEVTLEAGRLKARGSQLLIGEELNQFIGKVTEWKTKYDKSTGDKPDTPASEKEDLTGKEPRAQTTGDGGLSPQIPEVSTTGSPVTPLKITVNDNLGTFQDTLKKSFTYWMSERPKLEIKDPFVRYTFTSMEEARVAVMELPCMRIAQDTRVAICTELLIYGWYQVDEGRYEAILCGPDMTWNLWQAAKKSFKMHGGVLKDELSPSEHSIDYHMAPLTTPVFCKEEHVFSPDRKIIHKLYSAPNILSAIEFLKQNPVTQEDFKIIVETPDGVYFRDIHGIFKEPLQRARVEYLRDLEMHVLMDGTINENIVNLVEKKPIPIVNGKPIVSPAALDAVMLKLIGQKRLRGIAWNGIFFSEMGSITLLKQLAIPYPEISLSDLVEKFYGIEKNALRDFLLRLVKELKLDVDFDASRDVVVLQRKISKTALEQLGDLIRDKKQVDLNQVGDILRVSKADVERLIYTLAGEGTVEGEFQGDVFIIQSDVREFIEHLTQQFQDWEKSVEKKDKKV